MKQLTNCDLEHLALGSALLGSGGGGDPFHALPMVQFQVEQYGLPQLMGVEELKKADLVVPLSMMGAPLISLEKIPSGRECLTILENIERVMGRPVTALMAAEIGGANAFTPFLAASRLDLPILDADMIGRAFPALHMSSCYLADLPLGIAFQADSLGNSVMIQAQDPEALERFARATTVAAGSSSAVAFYLMDGLAAQKGVIRGSVSKAMRMGRCLAQSSQFDPFDALQREWGAVLLAEGSLIDIDQCIEEGFLKGSVTLLTDEGSVQILYQNEYLLAKRQEIPLAMTPDILVLLDKASATPITSEGLRFGLKVALMAFPSPKQWQTERGLQLVGPSAFGYDNLCQFGTLKEECVK